MSCDTFPVAFRVRLARHKLSLFASFRPIQQPPQRCCHLVSSIDGDPARVSGDICHQGHRLPLRVGQGGRIAILRCPLKSPGESVDHARLMPQVASVAVRTHAGWLGGGPFKVIGQDVGDNSSASGHPWRIISLTSSAHRFVSSLGSPCFISDRNAWSMSQRQAQAA